jgi:ribonuclease III, bacterial
MNNRPPVSDLEAALGVTLDPQRLEQALTHRSYAYENGGLPTNERLEFLGDSVLGLVVTTALYHQHPGLPEGRLAKLRASVVNSRALADVARELGPHGLGPYLLLGRGEESTGGRDKESILADTLEAIIGAVYLEYGLKTAAEVVHNLFDPVMARAAQLGAGLDWKTSLQELTASLGLGVPEYDIEQTGPDHAKTFTAWAVVAGVRHGGVQGRTKKEAEQRAAQAAFLALTADQEQEADQDAAAADGGDTASIPVGGAEVLSKDVSSQEIAGTAVVPEDAPAAGAEVPGRGDAGKRAGSARRAAASSGVSTGAASTSGSDA